MLNYKMDFSSCDIMPGFGKSSQIFKKNVNLKRGNRILKKVTKQGEAVCI